MNASRLGLDLILDISGELKLCEANGLHSAISDSIPCEEQLMAEMRLISSFAGGKVTLLSSENPYAAVYLGCTSIREIIDASGLEYEIFNPRMVSCDGQALRLFLKPKQNIREPFFGNGKFEPRQIPIGEVGALVAYPTPGLFPAIFPYFDRRLIMNDPFVEYLTKDKVLSYTLLMDTGSKKYLPRFAWYETLPSESQVASCASDIGSRYLVLKPSIGKCGELVEVLDAEDLQGCANLLEQVSLRHKPMPENPPTKWILQEYIPSRGINQEGRFHAGSIRSISVCSRYANAYVRLAGFPSGESGYLSPGTAEHIVRADTELPGRKLPEELADKVMLATEEIALDFSNAALQVSPEGLINNSKRYRAED